MSDDPEPLSDADLDALLAIAHAELLKNSEEVTNPAASLLDLLDLLDQTDAQGSTDREDAPFTGQDSSSSSRWSGPAAAGLLAVVLTAAVVVGVFGLLPRFGRESDARPGPSSTFSSVQAEVREDPYPTGQVTADDEAHAIDDLLSEMTASRKKIASLTYTCSLKSADLKTLLTALNERTEQLNVAGALSVDALKGGKMLKTALMEALQASMDANEDAISFLDDEDGCDGDAADRFQDENEQAGVAKTRFLGLWNPIAAQYGLPKREFRDI